MLLSLLSSAVSTSGGTYLVVELFRKIRNEMPQAQANWFFRQLPASVYAFINRPTLAPLDHRMLTWLSSGLSLMFIAALLYGMAGYVFMEVVFAMVAVPGARSVVWSMPRRQIALTVMASVLAYIVGPGFSEVGSLQIIGMIGGGLIATFYALTTYTSWKLTGQVLGMVGAALFTYTGFVLHAFGVVMLDGAYTVLLASAVWAAIAALVSRRAASATVKA